MKKILEAMFQHETLTQDEARATLTDIAAGKYNPAQISAFLTVFRMRSITVEELTGFRDALLDLCLKIDLEEFDAIDLCGTGGDGKDTFNISTLSSFVVAGAGVKVAKHGNYGVSSSCGSSNVMEHFGFRFTNDADTIKRQIDSANICFLHAPLFHPAMKEVAPIRREMGVKTFFNMLGPLVNPSFPQKQMVGVFSLELARLYNYLLQKSGKQFVILHALDGYDEISLTGDFKKITPTQETVSGPRDFEMRQVAQSEIFGGDSVADAAGIFERILQGEGSEAQRQVVYANAATAIQCARPGMDLGDAILQARESLDNGLAYQSFKKLLAV